jgi:hypothetical protein
LTPIAEAAAMGRRRAPRPGRNARMATRLEALAEAALQEAAAARDQGDAVTARAAEERAAGARRAAALLRAGPGHVSEVLAS